MSTLMTETRFRGQLPFRYMNNCDGTRVRDLAVELKEDVLCVCNDYHESRLGLGCELAGVAGKRYSRYTMQRTVT
jgi:hypothetical protein